MTTISSKHVLITGSASGIGRRLAEKMAAMGAHVSMWDMDEACLAGAAAGICAGGGLVREYCCDVSDRDAVDRLAAQTMAEGGPVDIVVNSAGVVSGRPLLELTPEQIERTMKVNVLALFWVTRAFLPSMIERGSGHIVTVASAAGLIGVPRLTDYWRQQARRGRFRRVLAPGATPGGAGCRHDGRLPLLHRHRHVRRGHHALPAAAADPQGEEGGRRDRARHTAEPASGPHATHGPHPAADAAPARVCVRLGGRLPRHHTHRWTSSWGAARRRDRPAAPPGPAGRPGSTARSP